MGTIHRAPVSLQDSMQLTMVGLTAASQAMVSIALPRFVHNRPTRNGCDVQDRYSGNTHKKFRFFVPPTVVAARQSGKRFSWFGSERIL